MTSCLIVIDAQESFRHRPYFDERGLPAYLVSHLATMADLHRAGRYDRMTDDVLTLTGQRPITTQEFVRQNASAFMPAAEGSSAAVP